MIQPNRLYIRPLLAIVFTICLMLPGVAQHATAQDGTVYGHATFFTPSGESVPGAALTLTTSDGEVLRETTAGVNDSVIWLSPRFLIGSEYCLDVDATANGYQPWSGCAVAGEQRLQFDVYLEPIVVAGVVVQNGNERPVVNSTVCIDELGVCDVTDGDGAFSFSVVPAGTYTVTVSTDGYKPTSTTVTVTDVGAWIDIVQYKGNGSPGNGNN